jgi:hypothetical protein
MLGIVLAAAAIAAAQPPGNFYVPSPVEKIPWKSMTSLLLVDMTQRVTSHETQGSGLSKSQFKSICASEQVWNAISKQDHVTAVDLEAGLLSTRSVDMLAHRNKQNSRKMSPEDSLTHLRDFSLNCTTKKLHAPMLALKAAFDKENGSKVIGLQSLSTKMGRIMSWSPDDAWDATIRSKDVDRSGTQSMHIKGSGACMFLAKSLCARDIDFSGMGGASAQYGLPGLTEGYLMDLIRGEVVMREDRHLKGAESPPVPTAAVARFLSSGVKIVDAHLAQGIVSLLDCDGTGLLDPQTVVLSILMAYSEAVQALPKRVNIKKGEDGVWVYEDEEEGGVTVEL